MKKQLTDRTASCIVIAVFLILSVLSFFLMRGVGINYDNADYLDRKSETRIAIDKIEEEFGMSGSLSVMIEDISAEEAKAVKGEIMSIPGVLNVSFDKDSERYYKNGDALLVIMTDGDDYSDTARAVMDRTRGLLSERYAGRIYFGGTANEKRDMQESITREMALILAISLSLVVVILLITSRSWLEPLILLAASGVAVLINRGTNIIFGEISYITNSIAAILQLALSIDYSIILLHTFRKKREDGCGRPMASAILECIKPVSASGLTTIAGLAALLFMSFRIGFDIGVVLIKGIVISAVCSMTLFPALILLLERALEKTKKHEFVPRGAAFVRIATKAGRIIVPVMLIVIIVAGCLQPLISYSFTDNKGSGTVIRKTFGETNPVIILYPTRDGNTERERRLTAAVSALVRSDGSPALADSTSYAGTVLEEYDTETAVRKLGISESEADLLYAMYHLYENPDSLKMTHSDFINSACYLVTEDEDGKEIADEETVRTLSLLLSVASLMARENTAEEFYNAVSEITDGEGGISLFSVQQMYGYLLYYTLGDNKIPARTALNLMLSLGGTEGERLISAENLAALRKIKAATDAFDSGTAGTALTEEERAALTAALDGSYAYGRVMTALTAAAEKISGEAVTADISSETVQQVYIMYFRGRGELKGRLTGRAFVGSLLLLSKVSDTIASQLTEATKARLSDMKSVDGFMADDAERTYKETAEDIAALTSSLVSFNRGTATDADTVSGVYIKSMVGADCYSPAPITAEDLLNFMLGNMDENSLLKKRMTDERREKVRDGQEDVERAKRLLIGDKYSRMLLTVDLPADGDDTEKFLTELKAAVREIFGDDACTAGEICTVSDMRSSFGHDLRLINVFTIISVFLIVALVFRSLSLPLVLVAMIQGAIWVSVASGLFTGSPIFFMSYIVATCILMGATIDYGILMSSSYVANRQSMGRGEALTCSLAAAMPTVFSSGLILTVCGFVIAAISSQGSISTVGLLIGKGALVSVLMITLVLPSVLFVLDKFILALSLGKSGKGGDVTEKKEEPKAAEN